MIVPSIFAPFIDQGENLADLVVDEGDATGIVSAHRTHLARLEGGGFRLCSNIRSIRPRGLGGSDSCIIGGGIDAGSYMLA